MAMLLFSFFLCYAISKFLEKDMLTCHTSPKDTKQLQHAVDLFNNRQWYDCHEVLEDLWRAETSPVRDVYKGILQIGVAMYHLERDNRKGALRLFNRGLHHIRPFIPHCLGLDLLDLAKHATNMVGLLKTPSASAPLHLAPSLRWTHEEECNSDEFSHTTCSPAQTKEKE